MLNMPRNAGIQRSHAPVLIVKVIYLNAFFVGWVERERNPPSILNGGFRYRSTHPTFDCPIRYGIDTGVWKTIKTRCT